MTPTGIRDGSRTLARQGVDPEEAKILALTCLVLAGGNLREAVRQLKAQHGIKLDYHSIARWRDRDPLLYERLRQELAPRLSSELIGVINENALAASKTERRSIADTERLLDEGRTRDPLVTSTIARNMKQIITQSIDKTRLLEDKPTRITENRSLDEILRQLKAISPDLVIEDVEVIEVAEITEEGDA